MTDARRAVWTFVLVGTLAGAAIVGGVGFVMGAGVPDERAGEAAAMLGAIGLLVGALVGAGAAALAHTLLR